MNYLLLGFAEQMRKEAGLNKKEKGLLRTLQEQNPSHLTVHASDIQDLDPTLSIDQSKVLLKRLRDHVQGKENAQHVSSIRKGLDSLGLFSRYSTPEANYALASLYEDSINLRRFGDREYYARTVETDKGMYTPELHRARKYQAEALPKLRRRAVEALGLKGIKTELGERVLDEGLFGREPDLIFIDPTYTPDPTKYEELNRAVGDRLERLSVDKDTAPKGIKTLTDNDVQDITKGKLWANHKGKLIGGGLLGLGLAGAGIYNHNQNKEEGR